MKGALINFEGTDASGKATQVKRLVDAVAKKGFSVKHYDFPAYDTPFGKKIKSFWSKGDEFGSPNDYVPGTSTTLNGLDQFQFAKKIRDDIESGNIVISDRYWHSNIGYDGARFPVSERARFYKACQVFFEELPLHPMPKPDHTIFLNVPVEISATWLVKRAQEAGRALDFNEKRMEYQRDVQKSYLNWYRSWGQSFTEINYRKEDELDISILDKELLEKYAIQYIKSPEEVHDEIRSAVFPILERVVT